MRFSAEDNFYQLTEDVNCVIIGDSAVECWIRHIVPNKILKPTCDYIGSKIIFNNNESSSDFIDFSEPVKLSVYNGGKQRDYIVNIHTFTGLPIVWIETQDRQSINSKTEYVNASFKLEENVMTRGAGDIVNESVKIRGRGNSSWTETQKKSYRLKFDEKVSLINLPEDKSWVLLANSFDKSMLRNYIAYYIGKLSNIDYTPSFFFVELILNGVYCGTYLLGDKLKIAEHRVNVGDDGFLLEIDERAPREKTMYFRTTHLSQPINIKEPDNVIAFDESYRYITTYIAQAEDALFSENFTDIETGWQKWMDIDSFVDWYIIHEIARNYDPLFLYTSAYMNLSRGGKLKMGPIWDFDVTFGNNQNPHVYPIEGLVGESSSWFNRLMQDPAFVDRVKHRYNYFYSKRSDILNEINATAGYLKYAVEENNNRWNTFYSLGFGNHDVWGSYKNEVQLLKDFIYKRMDWLKSEFDKM